jgi:hypothetical protein
MPKQKKRYGFYVELPRWTIHLIKLAAKRTESGTQWEAIQDAFNTSAKKQKSNKAKS